MEWSGNEKELWSNFCKEEIEAKNVNEAESEERGLLYEPIIS